MVCFLSGLSGKKRFKKSIVPFGKIGFFCVYKNMKERVVKMKVFSFFGSISLMLFLSVMSLTALFALNDSLFEQSGQIFNVFSDIESLPMSSEMKNQLNLMWQ